MVQVFARKSIICNVTSYLIQQKSFVVQNEARAVAVAGYGSKQKWEKQTLANSPPKDDRCANRVAERWHALAHVTTLLAG